MSNPPKVFEPVTLPCGRVIQNRLVKCALYEHLGSFHGGPPTQHHLNLYAKWAQHPWGMVFTGNVMEPDHLTLGRDLVIPKTITEESVHPYVQLARTIHGNNNGTLAIMQLSHGGRQSANFLSPRGLTAPLLAPSPVRIVSKPEAGVTAQVLTRLLFKTPHEMTREHIDDVVETLVRGALIAEKAGFDGVELHAAHGYLLAAFISPKTNKRQDDYSATTIENSLRLLMRIIRGIRKAVQDPHFVLGIKINSADYSGSSDGEERITALLHELAKVGLLDFIEVSGGDYESPDFLLKVHSASPRQALFARFSQVAVSTVSSYPKPPLIMLTGGLTTPAHLDSIMTHNHAQLLGIGRMAIQRPDLPRLLPNLQKDSTEPFAPLPDISKSSNFLVERLARFMTSIPLLGAGMQTGWYTLRIRELSENRPMQSESGPAAAIKMYFWFSNKVYYGMLALVVACCTVLASWTL